MLIVHKFAPAWGLPDISPFVVKLETWLRLAGVPYETKPGDPRKAPKGKIPYVVDDGVTMGDTRFIEEHLTKKHGVKLDDALTPAQRAIATAFGSMLEEHLYFVVLYERWQNAANWERYEPTLKEVLAAAGVPSLLRGLVAGQARKSILSSLKGQGTGRHAPDEVGRIGGGIMDAVATQIGEGPYFFGAQPSSIDATAYAFVAGILEPPFASPTKDVASKRPELRGYVDRIKAKHWAAR